MHSRVTAALLVVAVVAGAGCARRAAEDPISLGAATVAAVRGAPDAALDAGSVHFEMTVSLRDASGAHELVATGGLAHDQMTMTMDLGSLGGPAGGGTLAIVVDGATTYLRVPGLGAGGWLSIEPTDLGLASSTLGLGTATDPAQLLATLRGVSDDLVEVGHERVRDVPTTHLAGTIDVGQAIDRLPDAQRSRLAARLGDLRQAGATVPVEVWIDDGGLVRRVVTDVSGPLDGVEAGTGAQLTIELFDYGDPVAVVVPDPSDVRRFADLLGSLGAQG